MEQERALYQELLTLVVQGGPPHIRLMASSLGISTVLSVLTDEQVRQIGDALIELADRLRAIRAAAAGDDSARPH